ncbi:MAG TPA: hypothetical protein VE991_06795, partial [Acidimicrobiales bacterium]|nr:hypothetical protein [Acidimicrobiales bacterium]
MAGSVVTVLGTVLLPAARPVGADPLSSARAQAAQVTATLRADAARLDVLAQQYEVAQGRLDQIQSEMAQTRATIAQDQVQVGVDQGALRQAALAAYMTDTSNSGLDAIFGPSGEQAAASDEYKSLASGN